MDRKELLDLMAEGRRRLETAIGLFNENQLTDPLLPNAWSVKDVLAHIGFWEGRIASLYEILSGGDVPSDVVDENSVDALNERVHFDNQLLPLGIVQLNEKEAYQRILDVAKTAPDADLFDASRFLWTEGIPFYQFIAENTYGHYNDHLPDLLAAM